MTRIKIYYEKKRLDDNIFFLNNWREGLAEDAGTNSYHKK
jgi:hypothetical protein